MRQCAGSSGKALLGAARFVGVVQVHSGLIVGLPDVPLQAGPLRERSITELAGEPLPVVNLFLVCLDVALPTEGLPALRTGVDPSRRVLAPPVIGKRMLVFEGLVAYLAYPSMILTKRWLSWSSTVGDINSGRIWL